MKRTMVVFLGVLLFCGLLIGCGESETGGEQTERLIGKLEQAKTEPEKEAIEKQIEELVEKQEKKDEKGEIKAKFGRPFIIWTLNRANEKITRFAVTFQGISLSNVTDSFLLLRGKDKDFVKVVGKVKNLGPREGSFHISGEIKVDKGHIYSAYLAKYKDGRNFFQPEEERGFVIDAAIPQGTIPKELFGAFTRKTRFRLNLPKVEREKPIKQSLVGTYFKKRFQYRKDEDPYDPDNTVTLNSDGTFKKQRRDHLGWDMGATGTWELDGRKITFLGKSYHGKRGDYYRDNRITTFDGRIIGDILYFGNSEYVKVRRASSKGQSAALRECIRQDRQRKQERLRNVIVLLRRHARELKDPARKRIERQCAVAEAALGKNELSTAAGAIKIARAISEDF